MQKNIPVYVIDDNEENTCYAISLVKNPAVDTNFMLFSKEESILKYNFSSEEKKQVTGVVLRSDFPIYRRIDDFEFYVQFSRESIAKMHKQYMKDFNKNYTLEHSKDTSDVTLIESWLIEDPDNDKSNALNFEGLKAGDWMATFQIESDELWNEVRSGKFQGFSIESFLVFDEKNIINNLNKNSKKMNKKSTKLEAIEITGGFWDKLRQIIAEALGAPQKSAEVEKTVGKIVDEMEVEGGSKDEKPKVTEMADIEQSGPAIVDEIEKDASDEDTEVERLRKENEELKEVVKDLKARLDEAEPKQDPEVNVAEMAKQIEDLKAEVTKLSKQPSTKPVNTKASFSEETPAWKRAVELARNGR